MGLKLWIARVDPFRRESEKEILIQCETHFFEHRLENLVGRAGIRRRFEDDELAAPHVFLDLLAGRDDVGHIRVLRLAERRRDANDDDVAFGQSAEIGSRGEQALRDGFGNVFGGYIDDVRLAFLDRLGFGHIDLKTDPRESLTAKLDN